MVSSYKGTENNERPKWLVLTIDTNQGIAAAKINGVFRTETALVDSAEKRIAKMLKEGAI